MILQSQSTGRPNIVLYVVDALRPDRLGAYGYTKGTSPFLDRLAEQGIVFQNCYAAASWTKPAIASLFTSLYPQTYGVGRHSYLDVLPDSVPTLQDELRSHGYLTAQFSANPLSGTLSNLDQGFDYTFGPNAFEVANTESKQNKTHSDDLNRECYRGLKRIRMTNFFCTSTPSIRIDHFPLQLYRRISARKEVQMSYMTRKCTSTTASSRGFTTS